MVDHHLKQDGFFAPSLLASEWKRPKIIKHLSAYAAAGNGSL
jgi:hypothetical protein